MNTVSKDIKIAKHAGFCYGVSRAVKLSEDTKNDNPDIPVYIYGELIHNPSVINSLKDAGINTAERIEDIPDGGICIIRAHGVPPQIIDDLKRKNCKIIDATCSYVKKVQNKAENLAKNGYRVIIIGKPDHPEVIGIKAYADRYSAKGYDAIVISGTKELNPELIDKIYLAEKIGIVVQTTQKRENLIKISDEIKKYQENCEVHDTICSATSERQKAAISLAGNVELMVVVGSRTSANTTHLTEILCKKIRTIQVETPEDIDKHRDLFTSVNKIGVTAGASTPESDIEEVIKRIGEIT